MSGGIPTAAFASLIVATVIAVFDLNMINLATPVIAADLQVPVASALWLGKANLLSCALCLLPCAALGDVIGHRRLLAMGLALVAVTALGCASSQQLNLLIGLRVLQGLGSAAIMCSTLVLINAICSNASLGKAMGLNAMFVAVTTTAGPVLTGLLLQWLDWHWLFLLSVPAALLALALALITLPLTRVTGSRVDRRGCLLLAGLLLVLLSSASPIIPGVAIGVAAVLLAGAFVYWQRHCQWPLLPLAVFANRRLNVALLASCLAFVAQCSAFILMPLMLQQNLGYEPVQAAWVFIAWPLMTALAAPFAGRWADHGNARRIAATGLVVLALGLASLAALPDASAGWNIAWRMGLCGIGFGLFQSPNNREILVNVPRQQAARASALLCLARLLGQALGALWVTSSLHLTPPAGAAGITGGTLASGLLYAAAALPLLAVAVTLWVSRTRQWHRVP